MKKVINVAIYGGSLAGLGIGATLAAALIALVILLLKPVVAVLLGWVVGKLLAVIVGNFVASALTTLLGHVVTVASLPMFTAGLMFVASFFTRTASSKDKNPSKDKKKKVTE